MNNSILNFIATCVAFVSLSVNAEFTELLDVGYKHSSASEKNAQAKIAAKKQEQVTQQLVTQCAAAHAEIKKQSKASGGKAAASYPCDSDFMSGGGKN